MAAAQAQARAKQREMSTEVSPEDWVLIGMGRRTGVRAVGS